MLQDVGLILEFLRGLAFFVLGLFILFAVNRIGRLNVVRRTSWLALFAFSETLTAWVPVLFAALRISPAATDTAAWLQTGLEGLSGWALLAWGLLSIPRDRRDKNPLRMLPAIVLALWPTALAAGILTIRPDRALLWAGVTARTGLALPGGLLSAWVLSRPLVDPDDPPLLRAAMRPLHRVGMALAVFGILVGVVYPALSLLVPPTLEAISAPIAFFLALCAVEMISGLLQSLNIVQQEVEEWTENIRQAQALAADRERISRELHDGIIQSIYAAGLMLEGVRALVSEDPAAAQAQLSRVMRSLNQTIQDIRRYIFNLRGSLPDTDLVSGLEELLRDFRVNTLLETRLIVSGEERETLSAERRQHILQIVREALANVARHAHATRVEVHLSYTPRFIQLQIADNGVGLAMTPPASGQGLRNIRERTRLLEGTLDLDSAPGQGVTITLTVPYLKGEL